MKGKFKKTGYDLKPHSCGVTAPPVKVDGRAWGINFEFVVGGETRQEFFAPPRAACL